MPFYPLETNPVIQPLPGWEARAVHGERMTFVRWRARAGAILPEHSHDHEQIAHLIEGEFELTIDGETRRLTSGSMAVIPSNSVHSGIALTDCLITDCFAPVREDYREKWKADD